MAHATPVLSVPSPRFLTEKLIQTTFYTEELLHREAFGQTTFYIEELLHREAFTQTSLYAEKLLHGEGFPQRYFYTERLDTEKVLHIGAFAHNSWV